MVLQVPHIVRDHKGKCGYCFTTHKNCAVQLRGGKPFHKLQKMPVVRDPKRNQLGAVHLLVIAVAVPFVLVVHDLRASSNCPRTNL